MRISWSLTSKGNAAAPSRQRKKILIQGRAAKNSGAEDSQVTAGLSRLLDDSGRAGGRDSFSHTWKSTAEVQGPDLPQTDRLAPPAKQQENGMGLSCPGDTEKTFK